MSEKQNVKSDVSEQPTQYRNGSNGKKGPKDLEASSVYFKVAAPTQIVKRDGGFLSAFSNSITYF